MVVGQLWGTRTEVVAGQWFALVMVLQPWDCRSIAKASKVRIPHLPPRAERPLMRVETLVGGPFVWSAGDRSNRLVHAATGPNVSRAPAFEFTEPMLGWPA